MKIVVFTGAGISAESGLSTFRNSDGLWAKNRIEDVCTPEALTTNRKRVVDFYNMRRQELLTKEPNAAHRALVELEKHHTVQIITQNVDDLHERAGSTAVLHLHGELCKLCSTADPTHTIPIEGWEQPLEAHHPDGSLLRPYIVFFGEPVPLFEQATEMVRNADTLIVIGTSLKVYPAASLLNYLPIESPLYLIDPDIPPLSTTQHKLTTLRAPASIGTPSLVQQLIK